LAGVVVWVLSPDGRFTQRQLRSEAALGALTALLRDPNGVLAAHGESARGFTLAPSPAEKPPSDPLRDLYELLVQPIEDLLPPGQEARVVFVPRDELSLVPFAALKDRAGRQLVDRFAIWMAPDIPLLADRAAKHAGAARGALVVEVSGGAVVSSMLKSTPQELPSLPGAKGEADDVAKKLGARVLPSAEAIKAEVMRRMPSAAVIHFAAHGIANERDGLLSAIVLAPTKVADGLLTAREVMAMQLSADLVVLSACDTGRGLVQGDAIYGLPRAFLSAGATSVLSSLWKAADEPTRFMMDVFYRELLDGTDKARALRRAMLATRSKYPGPANWAGFILTGAPDFTSDTASWKGSARATAAIPWRRALLPVPADAHLLTDDETVSFTTARKPEAVMAYYRTMLAASGYEERVDRRELNGASFELFFVRGKDGDQVRIMGLSLVGGLYGPAEARESQLMVDVSHQVALPGAKVLGAPPPVRR
jgi:hypothetical protein